MSEKEAIEWLKDISNFSTYDLVYVEALLQLLEKKDKRIDELEKAFVEEDLKHRDKLDKLKDKVKEFEDYANYLIGSNLDMLEGSNGR